MNDRQLRILVADDHTLLREALCDLLDTAEDFEVVAQTGDGETAVRLAAELRPDVALLDVQMPRNNDPVATVRRMLQHCPGLRIIIVSMDDHPALVRQLVAGGVCGYVHKSAGWHTLAAAVRQTRGSEQRVVTLSLPTARTSGTQAGGDHQLSAREIEVLTLVASALSNRQVGASLGITEGTVKRHLRNLFDKLGAVSRIDAVNKAVAMGLVRPHQTPRAVA